MTQKRNLLKRGNHKLSTKIGIWTLPRSTCIGAGSCKLWCYGKKFEKCKNVIESRAWKLDQISKADFVERMIVEILKRKFKYIRVHECGDFPDQQYVKKWIDIASKLPKVIFFTYTKSYGELDFSNMPKNFIVFQSLGSRWDSKIDWSKNTARVIEKGKGAASGEYLCPYGSPQFKKCGETCLFCMSGLSQTKHVAFHRH